MTEPFLLPTTTVMRVRTRSDWHVGAGAGAPGDRNALIRRDADGLPYLPGTTLTGVLREQCLQIARGLDDGAPAGIWQAWHRFLFGSRQHASTEPVPAAVAIRAAHAEPALAAMLTTTPELLAATTFRKPGVKIDPDSGRAQDKFLRFTELARAGMVLRGLITLPLDGLTARQHTVATVLLVLGARSLRALGGDRRRGSGAVEVDLIAADGPEWQVWVQDCITWASSHTPPGPPVPATGENALAFTGTTTATTGRWVEIPLTITTVDPVRVPSTILGNVITGHDHIPGTTLLAWLLRTLDGNPTLRHALTSGTAVITHASPLLSGHPARRSPSVLRLDKHDSTGVLPNAFLREDARGAKATGWGVHLGPQQWGTRDPEVLATELITHNVITEDSGKPTSDDGGVFTVEAIPARRALRAVLRMRRTVHDSMVAEHGADWVRRLAGEARLGSAAKSEYGRVTVAVQPATAIAHPPTKQGELTVWALSEVLVRDEKLRYSGRVEDVVSALSRRLGVELQLLSSSVRDVRTDSWQGSWRLPRPSLVGLAAGSCLRLHARQPISADRLADLAAGGLGDRRGEGFGQLALNHPLLDVGEATRAVLVEPHPTTAPASGQLDQEDSGYLAVVREAALRATLTATIDAVPAAVRTKLDSALRGVSRSQRGAVRQAITTLGATSGASLDSYLRRTGAPKTVQNLLNCLAELNNTVDSPLRAFADDAAAKVGITVPSSLALREALGLLVLDLLAGIDAQRAAAAPDGRRHRRSPAATAVASVPQRQHRDGRGRSTSTSTQTPPPVRVVYRPVHTRWELTATLIARTPLHVGGSHDDPYVDLTVARDGRGAPYVPGTSLAGILRAWAAEKAENREQAEARVHAVFDGLARRSGPGDEEFLASLIEVDDAPLRTAEGAPAVPVLRDGVGIDRRRGAAAYRVKYEREVVRAGTRLLLRVRAEDVEKPADLNGERTLGQMLTELQEDLRSREFSLGAAGTRGLGRVVAITDTVTLTEYPVGTRAGVLDALCATTPCGPLTDPATTSDPGPGPGVLRIEVGWQAVGPLLVAASEEGVTAQTVPLLDAHPDTGDPVPVLPGASVKGVLSSEVERALRTLFERDLGTSFVAARADIAEECPVFGALFGSQDRRGALSIPDTYSVPSTAFTWSQWSDYLATGEQPPHGWAETTHVAIDRWSGGAANNQLFTVLEPHGLAWDDLRLDIDTSRLAQDEAHRAAAVTLLLYALADFAAGNVPLGHGTHRGMGAAQAAGITIRGTGLPRLPRGEHPLTGEPAERRASVLTLARALWEDPATWTDHLSRAPEAEQTDGAAS
ncbi:RAMP superfamily CRISPR-associated protein [Crossiella sp. SN42]|uniref:RAMP superfamily CRISPR-associated protein n=1 Tax=Crossiella sp. SN42 TaxID=2944808 RepID=UPI00207D65A3|nr:RAMP superfamily CRISPR-associated protein [Crossiella sp. SN42]MCO1575113.1 RAMP superfamily CRISPR-associated protein [Crossiella sp. SN42]